MGNMTAQWQQDGVKDSDGSLSRGDGQLVLSRRSLALYESEPLGRIGQQLVELAHPVFSEIVVC